MVLGRAPKRIPVKWPSKIGAPTGTTPVLYFCDILPEYHEINQEIDHSNEPLGLGKTNLWWIPLWSVSENFWNGYMKGSHPFFVPVLLHDLGLISNARFTLISLKVAAFNRNAVLGLIATVSGGLLLYHGLINKEGDKQ